MHIINDHHVRWMIRRDMKRVMEIENKYKKYAESEEYIINLLRQRNIIGMVVENDEVQAYVIYELYKKHLKIIRFATYDDIKDNDFAVCLLQKLKSKLNNERRTGIIIEAPETNLELQLFLKENKFRAMSILKNHFEDPDEDAYVMKYMILPDGGVM